MIFYAVFDSSREVCKALFISDSDESALMDYFNILEEIGTDLHSFSLVCLGRFNENTGKFLSESRLVADADAYFESIKP